MVVTEFWRRWHISFFNWLRDYLWFLLGGNRHGSLTTYRNLMLAILLGGLWHGASWSFVIWGGWQRALLWVEHAAGVSPGRYRRRWLAPLRVLLTFLLVSIGWVFFRARTLADVTQVCKQIIRKGGGLPICPPWPCCSSRRSPWPRMPRFLSSIFNVEFTVQKLRRLDNEYTKVLPLPS